MLSSMESQNFSKQLVQNLSKFHVLKHPYYQAWNDGTLSLDSLKLYARQYYHHVDAFPRYVSSAHSMCTDQEQRQLLLENLIDEERGPENHPELWLRFAEGLGQKRNEIFAEKLLPETKDLIDSFFENCRSSGPEALGALFAYEHQIPEVAKTKIKGLIENYQITDEATLKFFQVHEKADEYHTEALCKIMDKMTTAEQEKAKVASEKMAEKIWNHPSLFNLTCFFVRSAFACVLCPIFSEIIGCYAKTASKGCYPLLKRH